MLPDCKHADGFRCHVSDRGGQWAICRGCGVWCFIAADGQVFEHVPQDDGDMSQHTRKGDDADAPESFQSGSGV